MKTEHIEVVDYDSKWVNDFNQIKGEIEEALKDLVLAVEHVGSTSVPLLAAKPIIDLDVVIDQNDLKEVIYLLENHGYIYEGDLGLKDREAFRYEGKEHLRTHHLYVCPQDSKELKRHLAFRNYLRKHPNTVKEYGKIKKEAAKLYPNDIEKYCMYKSQIIEKSYKGFMAWLVLFCVGVLAIIFMDIKNIDLVGLVLGNYMFITLAILTGMIYKNEAIYWYTGISYQEACAVTSKQRKEYAYKHFIRFLMVCLGYFVYSIIAYFLSFSFCMSIIICCLLMTVCALSTVSIKL